MASQMIITAAGLDALVDAQNGVTEAIEITEIGLTAAEFVVAPTLVALPGEFKRLASISGASAASNIIHYNVQDASTDAYEVRGLGAYLADGTLFAVYGEEEAIFAKSDVATFLLSFDVAFVSDIETAIVFGDATFLFPPATEEAKGAIEIATQGEVDAGTDQARAVTPKTLAQRLTAAIAAVLAQITPSAILAKLLSVDGSGSGLDADLLDGQHGAYYRDAGNLTGTVTVPINASLTHRVGGGYLTIGSYSVSQYGNGYCRLWWNENTKQLTVNDANYLVVNGGTVWHSANDGAGSGLDADMLDGQHASAFLLASNYTAADVRSKLLTVDGAGSGVDADLLDGYHASAFLPASNYTAGDVRAKLLTVDGAGSGVDADLLDGYHADNFLREIASNSGANGYKRLADGWIIQWVAVGCSASGASSFSWPIAFPNAVFAAVPGGRQGLSYSGSYSAYLSNVSTTGGSAYGNNGGSASSTVNIIAIGN